jgi:DNA-binding beta-propeller fold protein YncE
MRDRTLVRIAGGGLAALALAVAGCASTGEVQKPAAVYYPDPPDLPRIQFLRSFTGARDIEAPKSAFETFVTGELESKKRLDKPYGIAVHKGKIYVCDTNQTVLVFDLENRKYGPLQGAQGMGKLLQPFNISIDGDGNKYVADTVRKQVVVFDRNDFYFKAFGLPEAWKPVDAVAYGDRLYVADIENGAVVVLDKETGSVVKRFGQQGEPEERLHLPTNLAFDKEGTLYVSDAGKFRIFKFDRDGHFRGAVGRHGSEPGAFARPRGVALDGENRLYAVDAAFENVQIFTADGQLLLFFGKASRGPGGFYLPARVAIDYEHGKYFQEYVEQDFEVEYLFFVTNQFGDRMVNVYAYGKQRGRKYPKDEEIIETLKERFRKEQGEAAPGKGEEGGKK